MNTEVIPLTDESFEQEVVACDQPVLVDFYTPDCAPCRQIAPVIDQLSIELKGQVKVCKINAGDNMRSAMRFGITVVPTMIIFVDGTPRASVTGFQKKDRLLAEISRVAG